MPEEDKYKTIKTTNKKIKETVLDATGGMEVLRQLGWVEAGTGETLNCTRPMTMAQVRMPIHSTPEQYLHRETWHGAFATYDHVGHGRFRPVHIEPPFALNCACWAISESSPSIFHKEGVAPRRAHGCITHSMLCNIFRRASAVP